MRVKPFRYWCFLSETMRWSCGATLCAEDAIVSKSEVSFPSPIKVPHPAIQQTRTRWHNFCELLRLLQAIVNPIVDHFLDPDKAVIKVRRAGRQSSTALNIPNSRVQIMKLFRTMVDRARQCRWGRLLQSLAPLSQIRFLRGLLGLPVRDAPCHRRSLLRPGDALGCEGDCCSLSACWRAARTRLRPGSTSFCVSRAMHAAWAKVDEAGRETERPY